MKVITNTCKMLVAIMLFTGYASMGQSQPAATNSSTSNSTEMKTYLIERDIPNAGKLTPVQLQAISQKSCTVLKDMGPGIQWIQSYVTADKIYCVYKAQNEDLIREHAQRGGFPANFIMEISTVISPATAESH